MTPHVPDWSFLLGNPDAVAAAATLLGESFASATRFDALNRVVASTGPDGSEFRPAYNKANLLERVDVKIGGASTTTPFVTNIDYNARGQRATIAYANGVHTGYTYDPDTFRLLHLHTTRMGTTQAVQDISFAYDPVGNILEQQDVVQPTLMQNNSAITPQKRYRYNALYQLVEASAREEAIAASSPSNASRPWVSFTGFPGTGDLRNYKEAYRYDLAGNLLNISHRDMSSATANWNRSYQYDELNNRIHAIDRPAASTAQDFTYDAHGSMLSMPYGPLSDLNWDHKDQLGVVDLSGGGMAYYHYKNNGQRIRKVIERNGGVREERIYLGGYEIYRKYRNNTLEQQMETLHIMDDTQRIALVESTTLSAGQPGTESPRFRYQLNDHLGSASMEVDASANANIISYEEYHPFGTTAYRAKNSTIEVSEKRYRYTGMERDEETGMAYHTARYYMPWLGRWTSTDPIGLEGGTFNLYEYAANNPIHNTDLTGNANAPIHDQLTRLIALQYTDRDTAREIATAAQAPDEKPVPGERNYDSVANSATGDQEGTNQYVHVLGRESRETKVESTLSRYRSSDISNLATKDQIKVAGRELLHPLQDASYHSPEYTQGVGLGHFLYPEADLAVGEKSFDEFYQVITDTERGLELMRERGVIDINAKPEIGRLSRSDWREIYEGLKAIEAKQAPDFLILNIVGIAGSLTAPIAGFVGGLIGGLIGGIYGFFRAVFTGENIGESIAKDANIAFNIGQTYIGVLVGAVLGLGTPFGKDEERTNIAEEQSRYLDQKIAEITRRNQNP